MGRKDEENVVQKLERNPGEEDVLAMSEDLKSMLRKPVKTREEVKDTFKERLAMCHEAEVIMAAKRMQEEEFKRSLGKDAAAWDETGR